MYTLFILIPLIAMIILLTIIGMLRTIKYHTSISRNNILFAAGILVALTIAIGCPCYSAGYSDFNNLILQKEKEAIVERINNDEQVELETIDAIQEYNEAIERANNLWCRFTLEDRSSEKIEVSTYLSKFKREE